MIYSIRHLVRLLQKLDIELDFYGDDKYVSVVIFENETKYKVSVHEDIINVEVLGIMLDIQ